VSPSLAYWAAAVLACVAGVLAFAGRRSGGSSLVALVACVCWAPVGVVLALHAGEDAWDWGAALVMAAAAATVLWITCRESRSRRMTGTVGDGEPAVAQQDAGTPEDRPEGRPEDWPEDWFVELLTRIEVSQARGFRAGRAAHDLTSLLSATLANVDLMRMLGGAKAEADSEFAACVDRMEGAAETAIEKLDALGLEASHRESVRLDALIHDLEPLLRFAVRPPCRLVLATDASVPAVLGDVDQLRQLILSLTYGVAKSSGPDGGVVRVACTQVVVERAQLDASLYGDRLISEEVAAIEIEGGCFGSLAAAGPSQSLESLLEAADSARHACLEVVAGILRAHGGALHTEDRGGGAARVSVWLPLARRNVLDEPIRVPLGAALSKGTTVLLVDDQEAVLQATTRILEAEGFEVAAALSGADALDILRERGTDVGFVLLDVVMPEMDGVETFRELRQLRPDLPIVLASGLSEQEVLERMGGVRPTGYLKKPYRHAEVVRYLGLLMQ